jgi:cytochrome P450
MQFMRDPYGATLRTFARYGDPYSFQTGVGKMVFTGDPEGVREILGADPDTFGVFAVDLLAPVLGENSLLLLGGAHHRAARKLLAPPFHGARMRAYGETIRAITLAESARWEPGKPFTMQTSTQAISQQVIIQTVFGVTAPDKVARFQHALVDLIAKLKSSFMFIPWLQSNLWLPWARYRRSARHLEQLIVDEIRERRARGLSGEDILSMLLQARYDDGSAMDERELFEQLTTLLIAGHETTAIALAWACHLVHTHRAVEGRLTAELRALGPEPDPEAVAKLPYLDAVCNETLRLKPLTPSIVRRLERPLTLRGHELPAGIGVGASILRVHRQEQLYPDAEAFKPERFLERSFAPYEFLPFGGGARRCLGAAFALYEMKIVLATMLERYVLRSGETKPVRVISRSSVVGPRGGVRMLADRRAA